MICAYVEICNNLNFYLFFYFAKFEEFSSSGIVFVYEWKSPQHWNKGSKTIKSCYIFLHRNMSRDKQQCAKYLYIFCKNFCSRTSYQKHSVIQFVFLSEPYSIFQFLLLSQTSFLIHGKGSNKWENRQSLQLKIKKRGEMKC